MCVNVSVRTVVLCKMRVLGDLLLQWTLSCWELCLCLPANESSNIKVSSDHTSLTFKEAVRRSTSWSLTTGNNRWSSIGEYLQLNLPSISSSKTTLPSQSRDCGCLLTTLEYSALAWKIATVNWKVQDRNKPFSPRCLCQFKLHIGLHRVHNCPLPSWLRLPKCLVNVAIGTASTTFAGWRQPTFRVKASKIILGPFQAAACSIWHFLQRKNTMLPTLCSGLLYRSRDCSL